MRKPDDRTRLRHMLDAGLDAQRFAAGRTRADLESDRGLALILVKCIEIIGEAAAHLTTETRAQFPQVPWQEIIGMRNHLIHAYYDIAYDVVWDTVHHNLPPLLTELKAHLEA